MISKYGFAFCLMAIVTSIQAFGQNAFNNGIHQPYISIRAMGMGNAFSAVVDDHNAIYYNPAALARRKDGQIHAFIRAGGSKAFMDLADDIDKANKAQTEEQKLENQIDLIEKNYGTPLTLRAPALGFMWVRPNWGMSILPVDTTVEIEPVRGVAPGLNVNAYTDTNITYSYAKKLNWMGPKHKLWGGATVKALHRIQASKLILATELISDTEIFDTSDAQEGMTLDVDLGFMYEYEFAKGGFIDKYFKPTFAFVIRNVGDYGFPINFNLLDDNSKEPDRLQRRFDLGSKFDLPNFWVFDPHFAFDLRDIGHDNWTLEKGLHMGFELFWEVASWWRGTWTVGLNQMYPTYGFGGKLGIFQLDIVSFGQEMGTSGSRKEDRIWMLETSLNW